MKEGLRSRGNSDQILDENVPLISLISKKKVSNLSRGGKSSGKRVTFDLKNVERKRSSSVSSDSDSDSNLLVSTARKDGRKSKSATVVEKSSVDSCKRKRNSEAEKCSSRLETVACSEEAEVGGGKDENDIVYVKRSRLDVFEYDEDDFVEYNEDDFVEYMAMKKDIKTELSGDVGPGKRKGSKTDKKKPSLSEKNRELDVADDEKWDADEVKPIRSMRILKKKSKVSRKNCVTVEGGLQIPVTKEKVKESDHSEAQKNEGVDVSDNEKCETDEDKPNQSVCKLKRKSKVSHKDCIIEESDSLVPAKEKMVEEADRCEAEENRTARSDASSIGRRTRSSVSATKKTEHPAPPEVRKKLNSPKKLLRGKSKERQLKKVEKSTSSRPEQKYVGSKYTKKEQRNKERAASKTGLNLPTKLSQKSKSTEKQSIREQIQKIVESAGWTIEYRQRQQKEYSDAVYVDLAGHAYWSCIKAYNALLNQKINQESDLIHCKNGFSFIPLPEELLNKLTRLTKVRIARESNMNAKEEKGIKKRKRAGEEKSSDKKQVTSNKGSKLKAGKLHHLIKKDGKLVKAGLKRNGFNQNRKKAVKKETSTQDLDEVDNGVQIGTSKRKNQGGYTLSVRDNSDGNDFIAYPGKLSVLSWLIDSEILPLGGKMKYMNKRRTRKMMEGSVTRDGINCCCCNEIVSISEFEAHAGSVVHQPSQNIFVENGVPLFQCQIDAWNKQDESEHSGFYFVDITSDDPNDDTCCICGDGGDLICCDGCPSTFHQSCLDIQVLPKGVWHCSDCCCKFCGLVGCSNGQEDDATISKLRTCSLCEEKYHEPCVLQRTNASVDSDGLCTSFCGQKCEELFEHLQKLLGIKHELEAGYSWTVIRRFNLKSDTSICGLPQKVACNSKLALALNIMDECFLPTIDERSGINLLHNVVYNCGSNFKRLNYKGFYTFLLERDDEIISAASIRIRGAKYAEMPFIGTRHMHRRQGMARRLLNAIELALGSIDIEKLIIPAVAELEKTWTTNFGFIPLEESFKETAKSLNMLVFPGVAMLQKLLLNQNSSEVAALTNGGSALEAIDLNKDENVKPNSVDSDVGMDLDSDPCDREENTLRAPEEETLCSISQPQADPISETKSLSPETEENPPPKANGIESDPQVLGQTSLKVNGCVLDLNAPGEVNVTIDGVEPDLHSSEIIVVKNKASIITESNREASSVVNCNGNSANGIARVTRSRVKISLDLNSPSEAELEPNFQISSRSSCTSDLVQKTPGDCDSL